MNECIYYAYWWKNFFEKLMKQHAFQFLDSWHRFLQTLIGTILLCVCLVEVMTCFIESWPTKVLRFAKYSLGYQKIPIQRTIKRYEISQHPRRGWQILRTVSRNLSKTSNTNPFRKLHVFHALSAEASNDKFGTGRIIWMFLRSVIPRASLNEPVIVAQEERLCIAIH